MIKVQPKFGANFFYLCMANSCLRPARISFILQKCKTGLREKESNTSTIDAFSVTIPAFERVLESTGTATANDMNIEKTAIK